MIYKAPKSQKESDFGN